MRFVIISGCVKVVSVVLACYYFCCNSVLIISLEICNTPSCYNVCTIHFCNTVYSLQMYVVQNMTVSNGAYKCSAGFLRTYSMEFIQKCNKCSVMKFDWWPVYEPDEEELQLYTCIKCVDHENKLSNIIWFVALHWARFPPEVFHFLYTNNHATITAIEYNHIIVGHLY